MKFKKEYAILFLIIAALVLYIVLRKENRIQYDIPELAEIAPETISKIVINGDGKETVLIKDKDQWLVGPARYTADSYKIKKMIDFLEKPVLTTVASESKDYMRYGLDDKNRIEVITFSGDERKRVIDIGNQADIHNYTFIKLEDDHRVFHAREDLRDTFTTDMDEIRDKAVLSFNPDKIESIRLSKDGKEWAFNRKVMPSEGEENKQAAFQWETGDGKTIDDGQISSLLDDLLKVKCSGYLYDIKKDELEDPLYTLKVRGTNEHALTVFPKKEEEDYTALSSDNPSIFNLYSWRIDNIIEKFDKMLGIEEKSESES